MENMEPCYVGSLQADVLELPYVGDDISMLVLKPVEGGPLAVKQLVQKIDSKSLESLMQKLNRIKTSQGTITIPKFTAEQRLELTSILESMNIGDLFRPTADLSTLSLNKALSFSEAVHKAKIEVNEVGTEAAAATALVGNRMASTNFNVNSPFVYILYVKPLKSVAFFGIYNAPQQQT